VSQCVSKLLLCAAVCCSVLQCVLCESRVSVCVQWPVCVDLVVVLRVTVLQCVTVCCSMCCVGVVS